MITNEIQNALFQNADENYKSFHSKLIPNVPPEKIIGVRTPIIRKLAKEYAKNPEIETFLNDLPHKYYDENNLHGFIIAECKDYEKSTDYINAFLPYVDNWATCDLLRPKSFTENHEKLKSDVDVWLSSKDTYTLRFGIETVMCQFLDGDFHEEYLEKAANIQSDEYYIKMMQSWFFATALAKQWDKTVKFIEERRLPLWVHRKTIQKAVESFRITDSQKEYLKNFR